MTSLLYYSISSNFTKDEIRKIDIKTSQNRQLIFFFIKELEYNSKAKAKRIFTYGLLLYQLSMPIIPCTLAIIVPFPQTNLNILSSKKEYVVESNPKIDCNNIANIINSNNDKITLTTSEIEDLGILLYKFQNGSITLDSLNKAIFNLRGGDRYHWAALLLFIGLTILNQASDGFMVYNPLPHRPKAPIEWLNQYKLLRPDYQETYLRDSIFDSESQSQSQRSSEEKNKMTEEQAIAIINERYNSYLSIENGFKVTDRQAFSHLYHANGFKVKPEDYGMTQTELEKLREKGLVKYVQDGNKLPSKEHIEAFQLAIRKCCLDTPKINKRHDTRFYNVNGKYQVTSYRNGRHLIWFNQTNKEFISGDKRRTGAIRKFTRTNQIGGQKWITKWGDPPMSANAANDNTSLKIPKSFIKPIVIRSSESSELDRGFTIPPSSMDIDLSDKDLTPTMDIKSDISPENTEN